MVTVAASQPKPGITLLTLNRPERLYTMNFELVADLHDAFGAVAADPDCRVVVLTGGGRGFCAGLDLKGTGAAPGSDGYGRPQAGLVGQQHIARRSGPQPVSRGA